MKNSDIRLKTVDVAYLTGMSEMTLLIGTEQGKFTFGIIVQRGRRVPIWSTPKVFDYVIDNETLAYKAADLSPCRTCESRSASCHSKCWSYRKSQLIKETRKRQQERFRQLSLTEYGADNRSRGGKYNGFNNDEMNDQMD